MVSIKSQEIYLSHYYIYTLVFHTMAPMRADIPANHGLNNNKSIYISSCDGAVVSVLGS